MTKAIHLRDDRGMRQECQSLLKRVLEDPLTTLVLQIFTLCAFAVSQPLYGLLGKNVTFFTARGADPGDPGLMVLVLSGVLPLALSLLVWGLRSLRLEAIARFGILSGLTVLLLLPLLKAGLPYTAGSVMLGMAGLLAAGSTLLLIRFERLGQFLAALSPAAVIFPLLYLFFSPTRDLLFTPEALPTVPVTSNTPVVMVILDELPTHSLLDERGAIDARRYPHFAQFARQATWYRKAVTVSDKTDDAVPAILTGRSPGEKHSPTVKNHPRNLFTLLAGQYAFNVTETVTHLCPATACGSIKKEGGEHAFPRRMATLFTDLWIVYQHLLLPVDLSRHLPGISESWSGFSHSREMQAGRTKDTLFRAFVRNIPALARQNPRQPGLHVLHIELPHSPWIYLPSGQVYDPQEFRTTDGYRDPETEKIWASQTAADEAFQRHRLQLGFTDRLVGELLDALKRVGLYDSALIVVTADHGIGFRAGRSSRFLENGADKGDILPVPLLVKYPGQARGQVSDRPAETLDILPTVADVLNVRLPWKPDGHSLFADADFHLRANGKASPLSSRPAGLDPPGPHRELVGRSVNDLPVLAPLPDRRVAWSNPLALADVDSQGAFVPARIRGDLLGEGKTVGGPGILDLALALNGRIVATARSRHEPRRGQHAGDYFSFMVLPTAFKKGFNSGRLYVVENKEQQLTLRPIQEDTAVSYRWDRAGRRIVSSDGRTFAILPGALSGEVRRKRNPKTRYAHFVFFNGWAVDKKRHRLPQALLIFDSGGRLLAVEERAFRYPNPEAAVRYGKGLENAGFSVRLPASRLQKNLKPQGLCFFALSENSYASELAPQEILKDSD